MLNHQNNEMETTVIRLEPSLVADNLMVRNASFEEAFGDYSDAKGKGRARRTERKLDRIEKKKEVKTARRGIKADRQTQRVERRTVRKAGRQDIRANQQQARQGRKQVRTENRAVRKQVRVDSRQAKKDTKVKGDQDRETYATEQEVYRNEISQPMQEEAVTDEQGGGYPEQGGGYPEQGGGSQEDWNTRPSDMDSQWDNSQNQGGGSQDSGYSEDYGADYTDESGGYADTEDAGVDNGAYGDDNRYDSPYNQEDSEFADDSNFNGEAMDGKVVVTPKVKETTTKLKNNEKAFKDLNDRRNVMVNRGDNTRGIELQIQKCHGRIGELHSNLEDYANADGNPQERRRRRREINISLGRAKRPRRQEFHGGSETPVDANLNPDFSENRIEIPAKSNFDGYDDELGREIIINGVSQNDNSTYTNDLLYDGNEPTSTDLFSNLEGSSKIGTNANVILSIVVGVGLGTLAIFLAKKKGWI